MGLKSVELQVAIPRSQDAGKMQDQLMRQGQQFQETLTKQQLREEAMKRNQVNQFEDVEHQTIANEQDRENKNDQERKQDKKQKNKKRNDKTEHPYLGTKIDFSG